MSVYHTTYPCSLAVPSKELDRRLDDGALDLMKVEAKLRSLAKKNNLDLVEVNIEYNEPRVPDNFYYRGRLVNDRYTRIYEFRERNCEIGFQVAYQCQPEFVLDGAISAIRPRIAYQLTGHGKIKETKLKLICGALGGLFGKKYALVVGRDLLQAWERGNVNV